MRRPDDSCFIQQSFSSGPERIELVDGHPANSGSISGPSHIIIHYAVFRFKQEPQRKGRRGGETKAHCLLERLILIFALDCRVLFRRMSIPYLFSNSSTLTRREAYQDIALARFGISYRAFCLLGLAHVGPQCQRSEYDHDRCRHQNGKPEFAADGALVEEFPDCAHYVCQRVYVDKVL